MAPREVDTWAARALRTLLANIDAQESMLIFPIAVTDAWTDGDVAFCVVYTPPLGATELVGVRRQRGDKHPDPCVLLNPERPVYDGFDPVIGLSTSDDPDEYALFVLDSIGDSLGVFGEHLRYDASGLGWWGTLADQLPNRPST